MKNKTGTIKIKAKVSLSMLWEELQRYLSLFQHQMDVSG